MADPPLEHEYSKDTWTSYFRISTMAATLLRDLMSLILTFNRHADDHEGLWPYDGAGQYTHEILQTVL